jgi:hypothetical protein
MSRNGDDKIQILHSGAAVSRRTRTTLTVVFDLIAVWRVSPRAARTTSGLQNRTSQAHDSHADDACR